TGKLVALARHVTPTAEDRSDDAFLAAAPPSSYVPSEGLALRGKDVLVVTVDALRADRLRAYGGSGLTPCMDELASHGRVFLRAYTPSPHTSYALASLWTGKFLRPISTFDASRHHHHPTVAGLLSKHGFQTAAFYPPAVFSVDPNFFKELDRSAFGFRERSIEFRPASERVEEVRKYLTSDNPRKPVFLWTAFFDTRAH